MRRNKIKVVPFPSQNTNAPTLFRLAWGFQENLLESEIIKSLFSSTGVNHFLSTPAIIAAANDQKIDIALLHSESDIARLVGCRKSFDRLG
ncbi:MAG: hypothetical protein ABTQ25_02665 [Nitrosomonas ureae]